jgi:DNA-binding transcriptional MerR regulator
VDAASEPGQPPSAPDTSITALDLVALVRRAATQIEITAADGRTIRFGHQLDIKPIGFRYLGGNPNTGVSSRQIARYLAKYVTKSVANIGIGTRKFSPAAIDQLDVTDHMREILKAIVALAGEENYREILSWVHTLGYRGHVMSKSRQFSTTMTALREHRSAWRKEQAQQGTRARCASPSADARHTCGTLMHLDGVPIAMVAAWLGHASSAFTMATYVHSQEPALAEAARRLARVVTNS